MIDCVLNQVRSLNWCEAQTGAGKQLSFLSMSATWEKEVLTTERPSGGECEWVSCQGE